MGWVEGRSYCDRVVVGIFGRELFVVGFEFVFFGDLVCFFRG